MRWICSLILVLLSANLFVLLNKNSSESENSKPSKSVELTQEVKKTSSVDSPKVEEISKQGKSSDYLRLRVLSMEKEIKNLKSRLRQSIKLTPRLVKAEKLFNMELEYVNEDYAYVFDRLKVDYKVLEELKDLIALRDMTVGEDEYIELEEKVKELLGDSYEEFDQLTQDLDYYESAVSLNYELEEEGVELLNSDQVDAFIKEMKSFENSVGTDISSEESKNLIDLTKQNIKDILSPQQYDKLKDSIDSELQIYEDESVDFDLY